MFLMLVIKTISFYNRNWGFFLTSKYSIIKSPNLLIHSKFLGDLKIFHMVLQLLLNTQYSVWNLLHAYSTKWTGWAKPPSTCFRFCIDYYLKYQFQNNSRWKPCMPLFCLINCILRLCLITFLAYSSISMWVPNQHPYCKIGSWL